MIRMLWKTLEEQSKIVRKQWKMFLIQIPEKQVCGKFSKNSRQILTVAYDKLFINEFVFHTVKN